MTQAITTPTPKPAPAREGESPLCVVCSKPVEQQLDSTCRVCSQPVHVPWKQGEPESACGQIVSTQASCGIAFVCNPCVENEEPALTGPPLTRAVKKGVQRGGAPAPVLSTAEGAGVEGGAPLQ